MPFDKFVDLTTLWENRRKAVAQSLRSINLAELNEIAAKHDEEFLGNPSRDNFVRLMAEHRDGSFYYAAPEKNIEVFFCRDADFGIWVLSGSGIGPLDGTGRRVMNDAVENSLSGLKTATTSE